MSLFCSFAWNPTAPSVSRARLLLRDCLGYGPFRPHTSSLLATCAPVYPTRLCCCLASPPPRMHQPLASFHVEAEALVDGFRLPADAGLEREMHGALGWERATVTLGQENNENFIFKYAPVRAAFFTCLVVFFCSHGAMNNCLPSLWYLQ